MSATTAKKRSKSRRRDRSLMGWVFSEPSSSLFPSREELVKLLLVVAIAASVAVACHFAAGVLNRRQKSFCESNESFFDLDPGDWFCYLIFRKFIFSFKFCLPLSSWTVICVNLNFFFFALYFGWKWIEMSAKSYRNLKIKIENHLAVVLLEKFLQSN